MLVDDIIMQVGSPFASPVMLCGWYNGKISEDSKVCKFTTDYRKLNEITLYP